MGKKKTKREEEVQDIWCFYCDRNFDDENILLQVSEPRLELFCRAVATHI
jgi:hypothetical protein